MTIKLRDVELQLGILQAAGAQWIINKFKSYGYLKGISSLF